MALGLPLLDAMIPAATALAKTAAAPKLRAGFFYIPHGAIMWNTAFGTEMDHWTPSGAGDEFQAEPDSRAAREAQALRDLVRATSRTGRTMSSVHTIVPATWLSGVRPTRRRPARSMAPTIDQIIAGRSARTRAAVARGRSETTTQSAACGTGAAATTARRCRSGTRRRRCRWSSIRARCSRSCSARATRPRSATPSQPRREHARHDHRAHGRAAKPTRPRRPRRARRLPRYRARDRAARREGCAARSLGRRRCPRRRSAS